MLIKVRCFNFGQSFSNDLNAVNRSAVVRYSSFNSISKISKFLFTIEQIISSSTVSRSIESCFKFSLPIKFQSKNDARTLKEKIFLEFFVFCFLNFIYEFKKRRKEMKIKIQIKNRKDEVATVVIYSDSN